MKLKRANPELVVPQPPEACLQLRLYAPSPFDWHRYSKTPDAEQTPECPRGVVVIGEDEDIFQQNNRVIIIQM